MVLPLLLCALFCPQDTRGGTALKEPFLQALSLEDPRDRERDLGRLIEKGNLGLEDWEAFLLGLELPCLDFQPEAPGRIETLRLELWTGARGVVETETALWTPEGYGPGKRYPLLIACHGTGGRAASEVSRWARVAAGVPMVVIGTTEQGEDQGYRFSEQERRTQLSLLRWALLHLRVDRNRVFLGGTSRGGHLTWDLGTRFPEFWAGLAPMIGGPRVTLFEGQNNMRLLRNLLEIPIRDLQGLKDDPNLLRNLRFAFDRLEKWGARDAKLITFPGLGHGFRLDAVDFPAFFRGMRRNPRPGRIHLQAVRLEEARRAWVRITRFGPGVEDEFRLKIRAAKWNKLDGQGRLELAMAEADRRTAGFEAEIRKTGKGPEIRIRTKKVRGLRLLLPRWLLPPGNKEKLRVRFQGRRLLPRPKQDILSFLRDFCWYGDLDRAPVAYVDLKGS